MTAAIASPRVTDTRYDSYRLDLRLGIPGARLKGALEWWLGDPGLCKCPDLHPYLILLEIDSSGRLDINHLMHAVNRIMDQSDPIQVTVSLMDEDPLEEASLYHVIPSRGLNDFVFLFSRAFPVVANQGTLAYCIAEGTYGSFTALLPLRHRDPTDSRLISPPKEDREVLVPKREQKDTVQGSYPWPLQKDKPVPIDIFRIVLRKNDIPVAEYDLVRKKWLKEPQSERSKNARIALRKYRMERGYQMRSPGHRKDPQIFVMSDLHLGHANSIPRYKRPFIPGNVQEMDRVLIRNWNWTVGRSDTIFYLGDLSYMSQRPPEDYLRQLDGNIIYVEGNHDPCIPHMPHCLLMRYREVPYLLIHDPDEVVKPFPGWIIHGHVHNKDIARYPFFDLQHKKINVSAELVGYRPVSFDEIHNLVTKANKSLEFRDLSLLKKIDQSNLRISA
jgi:calcineurin-like phosphoesterase family protein